MSEKDTTLLSSKLNDVIVAVDSVTHAEDLKYLTDGMKMSIVQGIRDIKVIFCQEAYSYFWTHDFEPTEQIIPIMREVVQYGGN